MAIFYTDSGSFNDISVTGSLSVSGSLLLTSTQAFAPSIISASQITSSNGIVTYGPLHIISSSGISTYEPNSAYWYVSGSSIDLWYKHKVNSQVKMDWFEGVLETGLIYGGIRGFNGSNVYINAGEGIIVNHAATTSSATSPTITYVQWPAITSSIDVTNGFVTYLAISNTGTVISQSTKFDPIQYHDALPLGAVGHFNQQAIAAKGDQVNTQHSPIAQLADFSRNFGPIKVSGYGITPQSSSLKFSRASGDAFIYGGFYTVNPETPSNYNSTAVNTGSLAYVYRSASAYAVDANNNAFFTDIKPGIYDAGTMTASLAANEWSIQRVFIEPVTGIHYIYPGQTKYTSLANAVSNLTTDTFAEGPATTLFTVFIGYLIVKGDTTNLADTVNNSVISAGLFRNTSAGSVGGGAAAQTLNDLSDVIVTSPINGQALVYNSGNWINSNPTSASYAISASYVSGAASDWSTLQNKPTDLVSSSTQVQAFLPGGTLSSSAQYPGWVTASSQIDYNSIQNKLSGVVSSSTQVAPLLPGGTVSSSAQYPGWVTASSQIDYNNITNKLSGVYSSSAFTSPSQGTARLSFNGVQLTDVDLGVQSGDSPTFTGLTLSTLTNTTAANLVVVRDSGTGQLFTTASVGGGGTGTIPDGTVSSSAQYPGWVTASSQIDYNLIQNKLSGVVSSSAQVQPLLPGGTVSSSAQYPGWVTASSQIDYNNITNKLSGVYSSSAFTTVNQGTLRLTFNGVALADLDTGLQTTDSPTFAGLTSTGTILLQNVVSQSSAPSFTGLTLTGALNMTSSIMGTTGSVTVTAPATAVVNLATTNYYIASAAGTGTITWTLTGAAATGLAQSFIIRYTNGGSVTNAWFTGTRWSGGVAPTLTTSGVDILGFTTDDGGTNWRGVLLQRNSS